MQTEIQQKLQLIGAWGGILYMLVGLFGWLLIAGFFPLMSPSDSPADIALRYQNGHTRIVAGMILLMVAAFCYLPFAAALSRSLAQIEGQPGVLTYSTLLGGVCSSLLTFYPAIWWLVAAFRPDRAADLVYLMNDLAWLQMVGGVTVWFAMPLSTAAAAFWDKSPTPVFPRWSGYVSIWAVLLVIPDQLIFFFHSGAFAWNGLLGMWVPFTAFGGWTFLCFYLLRKEVLDQRKSAARST